MAKETKPKNPNKAPGMFAQLREGVNFLKVENPKALPIAILIGIGVFAFITVLGLFMSGASILGISLWAALGLMTGYLSGLYAITRQANTAVFKKYANEPGRVSLVAGVLTRRAYKGTNQPTAVNPRTKDMVFRVVGPAGVVLLGDGSPTSTKAMLEDERRKIQRVAQGVQVHMIYCSDNGDGVPLLQLEKAVKKLKRSLNRTDIRNVQNRLAALDTRGGLPIPKGIDPMKVRAPKKMR
jgi:Domain of unknown function (DUF4191)